MLGGSGWEWDQVWVQMKAAVGGKAGVPSLLAERTPCITIDSFENFHDLWVERGSSPSWAQAEAGY